jgi:copper transport protein
MSKSKFSLQELRMCSSRWAVVIVSLALAGAWLLMTGPAVSAHALLVRSIPEANARLTQPPATIEMWFSEPLEAGFSKARLLNSLGQEAPAGVVVLDPSDLTHMTLPLGQLEPGIYTVAWQTLSQVDGHEWYGSFPVTVLNPDGSQPTGGVAIVGDGGRGELPTPGEIAARWLLLLGGALFFGAPLFQLVAVPQRGDLASKKRCSLETRSRNLVLSVVWVAVLAIILGSWLQILLQAFRLGGLEQLPGLLLGTRTGALALARQALAVAGLVVALGLSQPWPLQGQEWPIFLATAVYGALLAILLLFFITTHSDRFFILLTLALASLGMILATLTPRQDTGKIERRTWQALLLLAGVLLFSISLVSHAGAVPGSMWAVLGDYVHLIAAAVWIGGLLLLPILLWQVRQKATLADPHQLALLVRRFSYLAGFAVFVLIVTGLFNSLVELPSLASLWETSYGLVLLAKLFLIVLTLEVAFFNNRLVHRQAGRLHQAAGLHHLNRQVGLEAAFSLGIMLSVAILVQTPAPRSFAPAANLFPPDLPFNAITRADDLYIHVQVTPKQVGNNRFWVHLYHPDNSPIGEVQLARLLFNYREAQLGQARADLKPLGRNTFASEGAYMNQAGLWNLSLYVRRRGMDDALTEVSVEVPPPTSQVTQASLWENPLPFLPVGMVIAGGLAALGLIPFIWRQPLRTTQARLFPFISLVGGIIILTALATAVSSIPALLADLKPEGEAIPASPSSIAAGTELYQENCVVCHGLDGRGDGPQAVGLEPPPANMRLHVPLHSDLELYGYISQGFPGTAMPAFKNRLTSEEIWHLVNYLRDEFGQIR